MALMKNVEDVIGNEGGNDNKKKGPVHKIHRALNEGN
jgi:hypothetical protein